MNNKGISKLFIILIIAVIAIGIYFWFKYFSEPVTTVLTGNAEQSMPALDKAKKVSETVNKAVQATDETTRKLSENTDK